MYEIWMTVPLSYFLITVGEIGLENDCLLKHWLSITSILLVILKFYENHFKCNYLRDKSLFLKFLLHVWYLSQFLIVLKKKKWPSWLIYFRIYGLRKTWLDKCLKSPVKEHPSTVNMPNTTSIFTTSLLSNLFITLGEIQLQNLFVSDMSNLRAACYQIDCRWQVFSSY